MATKYDTNNPVGSSDPRDLFDNSIVIDEFANSSGETAVDRRGVSRKTLTGLDAEFDASQADKAQRFNQLLAASGYVFLDDYAAGIEVTEYNEVIRDGSGNLWRAASTTTLPYTTTGAGLPEGGAFVSAGDAVLRNDLMNSLANGQGALNVRGSVIYVDTIADLQALPTNQLVDGHQVQVREYHAGTGVGGGEFYWDSAKAKSDHNGGTVISPTVPWDGSQASLEDFLNGAGETDSSGAGCFIRKGEAFDITLWGAVGDGTKNATASINRAKQFVQALYIPHGDFLFSGIDIDQNYFSIYGEGYGRSKLFMDNSVRDGIHIAATSTAEGILLHGFWLQGNASNTGGITLGTDASVFCVRPMLRELLITDFTNTGSMTGWALRLNSNQNTDIVNVSTQRNHYGLYRSGDGFCTSTRISGKDTYFGRDCENGIRIDGISEDFYIDDAVIEGCTHEGIRITESAVETDNGSSIYISKCYFEDNMKVGTSPAAHISAKGNTTSLYTRHAVHVEKCKFAVNASAPAGTKYVLLNNLTAYLSNNRIRAGDIITNSDCSVRFENNRYPNASNYAADYKALAGNIIVSDFHLPGASDSINQVNYLNAITFPDTNRPVSDPHTLDDYEEGEFTPTLTGFSGTITRKEGTYTKIGNRVFFDVRIDGDNLETTWTASFVSLPVLLDGLSTASILNQSTGESFGFGYVSKSGSDSRVQMPTIPAQTSAVLIISGSYRSIV